MIDFHARLTAVLRSYGTNAVEIAAATNIAPETIRAWLRGRGIKNMERVVKAGIFRLNEEPKP